jgi:YVTN family beta-propeller protein
VIDTASNTVVATVTVGSNPNGVAVTPDGRHAYAANSGSNTVSVSVIATATNMVVATVPVGDYPLGYRHPGRETRLRSE